MHNERVQSCDKWCKMNVLQELKHIFVKSLEVVNPQSLINKSVRIANGKLHVIDKQYIVTNNISVVGFGKAVLPMALALEQILGEHFVRGLVSIPSGIIRSSIGQQMAARGTKFELREGAEFNLPDKAAQQTAIRIANLTEELGSEDMLIVLISGGGSALLPLPREPIQLDEKLRVVKALSQKGADIFELNCVRKRLSKLKGGGLATLAYPARVITLILSDIIGDPLDSIASGPTAPNNDCPDAAKHVLEKYGLMQTLPESIKTVLNSKHVLGHFGHVDNFIIGNNRLASLTAVEAARKIGYQTCLISLAISGDVSEIAEAYSILSVKIAEVMRTGTKSDLRPCLEKVKGPLQLTDGTINELMHLDFGKSICLIGSGEPTVTVRGNGKGGRNQELALQFSVHVNKLTDASDMNISLLSCGTDGMDGPTDAAGAVGYARLCRDAAARNLNPNIFLDNNDSYNFYRQFEDGKFLIKTGHTGTNVMDIHVLIVTNQSPIPKYRNNL